ncbi:MAG: hypothetical protein KKG09_01605 [Verrucomicrobia bacterium]|nr:hypothetical protein [Verrucomicrobiota bacterium]MBU4247699.1 hypothetical protein [Verrucomicrobiota bacterium]MBU4290359.1 hypothetical protein [Verrucomicrobiota bacterium]MBU4496689.1 hypothetical protein [Verrucomicrobiota bacterium]MCG2679861.1 hypothetical protein [Kiritimatiellia bacterium]
MKTKTAAVTFGNDVEFMRKHTSVVVLSGAAGQGQVAIAPDLQGRVMTSTAGGPEGLSYGWINRKLMAAGKPVEHINPYGGEDRFWIGPEGGQFSVFFKNGVPFDLDHWFTPAPVDTEPFELAAKIRNRVLLKKDMRLDNYTGTVFSLRVDREIRILERIQAAAALGLPLPASLKMVAFESNNRITNTGDNPWIKDSGLLSVWILGMFNPSPDTTIVVPFTAGPEMRLGPIVNDAYFGKVPSDRLKVAAKALFFKGDGCYRSKIGLSPRRAKPVLGSYDAANKVLTLVQYSKPEGVVDYVNSMWEIQKDPYGGDTVNSYNDGPAKPGAESLGPFYELETSSPAAALQPGGMIAHTHRTFHFEGAEAELDKIAKAILGVSLKDIQSAWKK